MLMVDSAIYYHIDVEDDILMVFLVAVTNYDSRMLLVWIH